MTTAHRPTFNPARGGTDRNEGSLSKLSQQYSARDMPSETKIKYRQFGQAHPDEIGKKDLRRDIQEREFSNSSKRTHTGNSNTHALDSKKSKFDIVGSSTDNLDADDQFDEVDEDLSDTDNDSDEDDDAELMAELERIKKERAAEKAAKEAKLQSEQEQIRQENILHGNPLLNPSVSDFKVKRRWDDDVVFKNCARGLGERKKEPTFINDAIRSEFHKKFMEKYIK